MSNVRGLSLLDRFSRRIEHRQGLDVLDEPSLKFFSSPYIFFFLSFFLSFFLFSFSFFAHLR